MIPTPKEATHLTVIFCLWSGLAKTSGVLHVTVGDWVAISWT